MPTDELERELRRVFARRAAEYQDATHARQRLLQRNYQPRGNRRRRLAAGITAVAAAGAAVLGLALSGVLGPSSARATGTIRTAAFVLTRNANGTVTLTLTKGQVVHEPAALQQALAHDGIPALIKIDTDCSSNPAPPLPSSIGVVSIHLPDGAPVAIRTTRKPAPPIPADAVIVLNPSAMPTGTEMFVGYRTGLPQAFPIRLRVFHLIYTNSYTCSHGFPPGPAEGQ
jgi:hypothetical protein